MKNYKEYKREYRHIHIDNQSSFTHNMDKFIKQCNDDGWTIINIMQHKPYHVSIIYEVKIEVI